VGSRLLVRTQTEPKGTLPTFADVWIEAAGLDPSDPRLVYAFTGDRATMDLFCRLGGGPQPERLRLSLAQLQPGDPTRVAVEYALAHPEYLGDATFALLTRPVTREEAGYCRQVRIGFLELIIGSLACERGTCPVVLAMKPERVAQSPTARRLVQALADDPGLLGDTVGLAMAGVGPIGPADRERTRAVLQEVLRAPAPRPSS